MENALAEHLHPYYRAIFHKNPLQYLVDFCLVGINGGPIRIWRLGLSGIWKAAPLRAKKAKPNDGVGAILRDRPVDRPAT
jgi:hypothetical protein